MDGPRPGSTVRTGVAQFAQRGLRGLADGLQVVHEGRRSLDCCQQGGQDHEPALQVRRQRSGLLSGAAHRIVRSGASHLGAAITAQSGGADKSVIPAGRNDENGYSGPAATDILTRLSTGRNRTW